METAIDRPSQIAQSPAAALAVAGLSKRYGRRGTWALRDLDLSIPPGTITALVGPNGAGKTTLIRSFIGFEYATKGELRVFGTDPRRDRGGVIDRVGYVSQASALYRGLSVGSHLELARSLRKTFDVQVATARLERFGIELPRRVRELSGGQQAQVMLSIALGTRVPVLLLDEPLASLDPLARHDFLSSLVDDVRERGATVLMSSHIISDVESACDSLIVLAAGRAVLHAPTQRALTEHRLRPGAAAGSPGFVATFARPGGDPVSLLQSSDMTLPTPTLEELVMGYLASASLRQDSPARPGPRR